MVQVAQSPVSKIEASVINDKCGADVAQMVVNYLSTVSDQQIVRTTSNAGSDACWVNAAEYEMLKHNKPALQRLIQNLISEGYLTREMFFEKEPTPDASYGLPSRSGVSLALDRALQKKYGADSGNGATDDQIKQFESDLRGESVSIVFNGRGLNGANGSAGIKTLLDNPSLAKGVRCSLRWADMGSQHFYHMITIREIKDGRVYFFQPNSASNVPGPDRIIHENGLESMTIKDFEKALRVAYVPQHVIDQRRNIKEVSDPAYALAARGELPAQEYMMRDGEMIVRPMWSAFNMPKDAQTVLSSIAEGKAAIEKAGAVVSGVIEKR
jgi:hypothetical protein